MNAVYMMRRTVAFAVAIIGVCMTLLHMGVPAHATTRIDPDATTSIEIHKLEQPDALGDPANGLPQETQGMAPVAGASFTAKRVPGIDLTTDEGQRTAGQLSAKEAAEQVANEPVAARSTTDTSGNATLAPLEVGLYLVQETETPSGYVASAPFLVALPLTHPKTNSSWLNRVHVYPKNAKVSIELDVLDQDAVTVGDLVRWTSTSSIPNVTSIDGYRVKQVLNSNLEFTQTAAVGVSVTAESGPELIADIDYTVTYSSDEHTITLNFLAPGRVKLQDAIAQDPHVQVQVDYDTTVLAEGEHTNEAILYPSQGAIEGQQGIEDTAVTKWGPISVLVHEIDEPTNQITGAKFQLYLSPEDAAAQRNPVTIDGVDEWETDAQGRLVVNGLRFSGFINGLERDTSDPLYRYYWSVPTHLPDGWEWVDATPQPGVVNSADEYQTLNFLVQRSDAPVVTDPGSPSSPSQESAGEEPTGEEGTGELSATGAQIVGALVLATVLLIGGLALVLRRRHDATERHKP